MHVQTGAAMQPHEMSSDDEMAVHEYVFTPEPAHPNFAFNVDGVDVVLESLTCRRPDPPPSPPLRSPPPPMPSPPPESHSLTLSMGLRSVSSRVAVAVIALLLGWRLLSCLCGGTLRRLCCGEPRRSVISASEGGLAASDATAADEEDPCWSVLLVVGGKELELPLDHTMANNVEELKEALADLAREALGPKAMPAAWREGDLRTMRVQYVDAEERPFTLRPGTLFGELRDSPYLRVTEEKRR